MCEKEEFGMGWIPDPPDLRDYDMDHPMIAEIWKTLPLGMDIPVSVQKDKNGDQMVLQLLDRS